MNPSPVSETSLTHWSEVVKTCCRSSSSYVITPLCDVQYLSPLIVT